MKKNLLLRLGVSVPNEGARRLANWIQREPAGTRIEAEGCARNYRFWSSADVQQLTSGTPNKRGGTSGTTHIWIHGSNTAPPTIRIRKLIVRSTNTTNIFTIEDGAATVILDSCDVKVPAGTKFKVGGSKGIVMKLGAGCQA